MRHVHGDRAHKVGENFRYIAGKCFSGRVYQVQWELGVCRLCVRMQRVGRRGVVAGCLEGPL